MGEAVVSGKITPDSYVVDKEDFHVISKQTGRQEMMLVMADKGGTEWKKVPRPEAEKLCEKDLRRLTDTVLKIEKHFGYPVDVEWAMEKGKLHIVQSRPITTLQDS
jgi:pyruvate,water dikinase